MTRRRSKAGGRRPGAGRKRLGDAKRGRRVQIFVTAEVDERITAAATDAGLSRSDWGAAALEQALERADVLPESESAMLSDPGADPTP